MLNEQLHHLSEILNEELSSLPPGFLKQPEFVPEMVQLHRHSRMYPPRAPSTHIIPKTNAQVALSMSPRALSVPTLATLLQSPQYSSSIYSPPPAGKPITTSRSYSSSSSTNLEQCTATSVSSQHLKRITPSTSNPHEPPNDSIPPNTAPTSPKDITPPDSITPPT